MDYWLQLSIAPKGKQEENTVADEVLAEPNNWLQQNNPMLLDIPAEQLAPGIEKNTTIKASAENLKFASNQHGFVMQVNSSHQVLNTGDVIETEDFLLHVQINKTQKERNSELTTLHAPVMTYAEQYDNNDDYQLFDYSSNSLLPDSNNNNLAPAHPLAFLGGVVAEPTNDWLLPVSNNALSPEDNTLLSSPNSSGYLQKTFEAPTYFDESQLEFSQAVDDEKAANVIDFPSDYAESVVTPAYADMQPKKLDLPTSDCPLDELDMLLSDQFDKSYNQSAGIHQQVEQNFDLDAFAPVAAEEPAQPAASESKLLTKLKNRLWRA